MFWRIAKYEFIHQLLIIQDVKRPAGVGLEDEKVDLASQLSQLFSGLPKLTTLLLRGLKFNIFIFFEWQ